MGKFSGIFGRSKNQSDNTDDEDQTPDICYDDASHLISMLPVFREDAIMAVESGKTEEALDAAGKLFSASDRLSGKPARTIPGKPKIVENYSFEDCEKVRMTVADAAVLISRYAAEYQRTYVSAAILSYFSEDASYLASHAENDRILKDLFDRFWPLDLEIILKCGTENAKHGVSTASLMALQAVAEAIDGRPFRKISKGENGKAFYDKIYSIVSENMEKTAEACLERFDEEDIGSIAAIYGKFSSVAGEMYLADRISGEELLEICSRIFEALEKIATDCMKDVLDDAASMCVSEAGDIYTDLFRTYRKAHPAEDFPEEFTNIREKLSETCENIYEKAQTAYAESTKTLCEAVVWNLEDEIAREQQV